MVGDIVRRDYSSVTSVSFVVNRTAGDPLVERRFPRAILTF